MNEMAVFRSFPSPADAAPVMAMLEKAGIYCSLVGGLQVLPDSLIGQYTGARVDLQILVADFARANALLEKNALHMYQEVPDDYYLYSFTNVELLEVVRNKAEWNEFDRALAEELLKKEGIHLTAAEKERMDTSHLNNLLTPKTAAVYTLCFGYLCVCSAIFFPTVIWTAGMITGYYLGWSYRRLPDGKKMRLYNARSRQHGKMILLVGAGLVIVLLLLGRPVYHLFGSAAWPAAL